MNEVVKSIEDQIKHIVNSGSEGYFTVLINSEGNILIADAKTGIPSDYNDSLWGVFSITNYIEE